MPSYILFPPVRFGSSPTYPVEHMLRLAQGFIRLTEGPGLPYAAGVSFRLLASGAVWWQGLLALHESQPSLLQGNSPTRCSGTL